MRCAFPIHDHIGGQRLRTIGYAGSLDLMDRATNAMLERSHNSFRDELKERFLDQGQC